MSDNKLKTKGDKIWPSIKLNYNTNIAYLNEKVTCVIIIRMIIKGRILWSYIKLPQLIR